MDAYTVKELKKMIMTYKKSNCPAVSKAKRAELLTMIKDLNISTDGKTDVKKEKTDSCVKCKIKMNLPKTDKIDLKKYENIVEFPKSELIGGDDLIESTESPSDFLKSIKKLYPTGYDILKKKLEIMRLQNKKNKTFLDIDDYFNKEKEKPIFFNNSFFKKFVRKQGNISKTVIYYLFKYINKKFLPEDIILRSGERWRL